MSEGGVQEAPPKRLIYFIEDGEPCDRVEFVLDGEITKVIERTDGAIEVSILIVNNGMSIYVMTETLDSDAASSTTTDD